MSRSAAAVRFWVCGALITLIAVSGHARAQDQHGAHPIWWARSAATDSSTASGMQPIVWTVLAGNSTVPLMLGAKTAESTGNLVQLGGWFPPITTNLASGIDAVSWTEGTTARQRVFFVRSGSVTMLDFDGSVNNGLSSLTSPSTFTVPVGDVAAVTWVDSSSVRRLAVAAYAAKSGVNGFLCFWEKKVTDPNWSAACTTSAVLPASSSVLPDIVGVAHGTTPTFYFRNANGRLGRAHRTGVATFATTELFGFTIGESLFATPSQTAGSVDVGLIRSSNNAVTVARFSSATSTMPTVMTMPALPNGALPNTSSNVSLSGASYLIGTTTTRSEIEVIDSAFRMHTIHTTENTGSTWETAWSAGVVPGNGNSPTPEQVVLTVGPTMPSPAGNGPRVFFVGGGFHSDNWATTLQEFRWGLPRPFMDHGRIAESSPGILPTTFATESSLSGGPVNAVAGAIERNTILPWNILLAGSDDNGSSFSSPIKISPVASPAVSVTDPVLTHGGFGGHLEHMVNIEVALSTSPGDLLNCVATAGSSRVVYRRGFTAQDLAAPHLTVAAAAVGILDHAWVGVTTDASDHATAHVLFVEDPDPMVPATWRTKYWMLAPGDVVSGPHDVTPSLVLTDGSGASFAAPPVLSVGNFQQTVYGWVMNPRSGFPKVCRMNGSVTTGLTCGIVGGPKTTEFDSLAGQGSITGSTFTETSSRVMSSTDVGKVIRIVGGANPGKRFTITAWNSATSVKVDPAVSSPINMFQWDMPLLTPMGASDVFYGAAQPSKFGECPGLGATGGAPFFKCIEPLQPVAVTADPFEDNRVYAVYQALSAAGHYELWFTRNTDNTLATWSAPIAIARDSTAELIKPAITVDYQGTIVVTYSRITSATAGAPTSGAASVFMTWSTTGNPSVWSTTRPIIATWNANNLPWHCWNRHMSFLGEYQAGDVVANRATHIFPYSLTNGPMQQRTWMFSRQFNLPP